MPGLRAAVATSRSWLGIAVPCRRKANCKAPNRRRPRSTLGSPSEETRHGTDSVTCRVLKKRDFAWDRGGRSRIRPGRLPRTITYGRLGHNRRPGLRQYFAAQPRHRRPRRRHVAGVLSGGDQQRERDSREIQQGDHLGPGSCLGRRRHSDQQGNLRVDLLSDQLAVAVCRPEASSYVFPKLGTRPR